MSESEELFDVVDECDEVVATLPRSEVHRRKLRHRAIHVFVFRSTGDILIHRRSPLKVEFPNVWTSSASGHVSAGETYDTAAPRELEEELGITGELRRLRKFDACDATCNEFTVLYQLTSSDPIIHDPSEIVEIRWMSPQSVEEWVASKPDDFSPAFRLLFDWRRRH